VSPIYLHICLYRSSSIHNKYKIDITSVLLIKQVNFSFFSLCNVLNSIHYNNNSRYTTNSILTIYRLEPNPQQHVQKYRMISRMSRLLKSRTGVICDDQEQINPLNLKTRFNCSQKCLLVAVRTGDKGPVFDRLDLDDVIECVYFFLERKF